MGEIMYKIETEREKGRPEREEKHKAIEIEIENLDPTVPDALAPPYEIYERERERERRTKTMIVLPCSHEINIKTYPCRPNLWQRLKSRFQPENKSKCAKNIFEAMATMVTAMGDGDYVNPKWMEQRERERIRKSCIWIHVEDKNYKVDWELYEILGGGCPDTNFINIAVRYLMGEFRTRAFGGGSTRKRRISKRRISKRRKSKRRKSKRRIKRKKKTIKKKSR